MQVPKEARDALGWETGTRLIVFVQPDQGEMIVMARPLDEELHDLATRGRRRRRTTHGSHPPDVIP